MTEGNVRFAGLLFLLLQLGPIQISNVPVQVTRGGNSTGGVALSRDGKLLAYALEDDGSPSSLWLRDTATGKDTRLPPLGTYGRSIVFAPDGKSLYFLRDRPNRPGTTDLMERVLDGATPSAKVRVEDVDTPITFSPDGKSFAFIRHVPGMGAHLIAVAAAKEREVTGWQMSESNVTSPAWSPDGSEIAVGRRLQQINQILFIPTGKGQPHQLSAPERVFGLAWSKNGLFVLMAAKELGGVCQIWRLSVSDGKWTQITTDEGGYENVKLTVSEDGSLVASSRYHLAKTGMDDLLKWVGGQKAAVRINPDVVLIRLR
jgi:Tol biopolymer transport system component